MNADLEELKKLVYGDDFDAESREYVLKLEEQFETAIADQKLLTIPSVVEYVKLLEEEIAEIKEKLSEKTVELTERNLLQLHERKRQARLFIDYFKPQTRVEGTIKQTLNVLKGKKDV